jgi:ribose 5-phosphate isomerase RpiB
VKVAVAFDHRGVRFRDAVIAHVTGLGHEATDLGTDTAWKGR